MRKFIAIFFILVGIFSTTAPVFACEPPPPSNEFDCEDLGRGYQLGFQIYGARNGTYYFTRYFGRLVGGAPEDRQNSVTISGSDSRTFDWSASMGIDAVIVNTGGQSAVTRLNEATSGNDYHGATNYYGKPYQVSKVFFCYDYELSVDVEAEGTATGGSSSVTWDITKSVDAAQKSAFAGEQAVFNYTVAVDAETVAGGDNGTGTYSLKTVLKIKNNTPLTARMTNGSLVLNPGNINLLTPSTTIDCGGRQLRMPLRLNARSELVCTLTTPLESMVVGAVTAQVQTYGYVGGGSDTADVVWTTVGGGTGEVGFDEITVTDTNAAFGGPRTATASQSWQYPVSLACPTDPAAYTNGQATVTLNNTAAIVETEQSASQAVTLTCYAPTVSTTASASYDVAYTWGITKVSPLTEIELEENETADVDYLSTVDVVDTVQSNTTLAGSVTIGNPNPAADMTVSIVDEIAEGVVVATDCADPVTIPAGGSVTCNFTTPTETQVEGTNHAEVMLNGIAFAADAQYATSIGNETDECVTVYDTAFDEPLGTFCADEAPVEIPYQITIGPYDQCQETSYLNTASFVTNDTGADGYSTWELLIDIQCPIETNCVRPISYWLNNSDPADPENYAPTWDLVGPGGPATPFFDTGFTWVEVLARNASSSTYYRLAQAYIAAKLNVLFGALPNEEVVTNMALAETLLDQYDTDQGAITGDIIVEFRNVTTVLSNFNRGVTGIPVCADCQD